MFYVLNILQQFASALANGSIRVVDLSQTLSMDTPVIRLPSEFAQSSSFTLEEISHYDKRGPNWYWNNFSCGEHTGTHFDAPIHWKTGKDFPNNATDTISVENFIAPAVVINVVSEAYQNSDFLLKIEHVLKWEAQYGRIPDGCWVLMRTDWSKRIGADFLNVQEDGAHFPGMDSSVVEFLSEKRRILGLGSECVGVDGGQADKQDIPVPCHSIMHGTNKFGLASLTNLDQLPPTGALLITPPLKIKNGSGSPCRVLALVFD